MPRVSIVVPAYNSASFVSHAYNSLAEQTLADLEIIFVNDGSQDDTLSVLHSFAAKDKRVKVIDLGANYGSARARNAALDIAQGDWFAVLDADDRYSPDRLEVLVKAAEKRKADIVFDNLYVLDPILRRVVSYAFDASEDDDPRDLSLSDYLSNVQPYTLYDFGFLKPVMKRSWLVKNNVRYCDELRFGQDVMLILECYARGARVILLPKAYYYYFYPASLTTGAGSPNRRTQSRYATLLEATERYWKMYDAQFSRRDRRLLKSRCESLHEGMLLEELRSHLNKSEYAGILRCLEHPIRFVRCIYFEKSRALLRRNRAQAFLKNGNTVQQIFE